MSDVPVARLHVTACLTYFRSLTLDNLRASLYSLRKQSAIEQLAEVVVVDNSTDDSQPEIAAVLNEAAFPIPTRLLSFKHGDKTKTHSWSSNVAIREAKTPWVFFTRADYILDPALLARSMQLAASRGHGWDGLVTGDCYWLHVGVNSADVTAWRTAGARVLRDLPGAVASHTEVDTGVYLARRSAFDRVGGLDENLTAWGHAQTHFQWKLRESGTEICRIPEVLYYHPQHGAERDLALANEQLRAQGVEIKDLWSGYSGKHPYR